MSHGAAVTRLQSLKLLGFLLQHTRHENGQLWTVKNARNTDEIRVSAVAGLEGFEPRNGETGPRRIAAKTVSRLGRRRDWFLGHPRWLDATRQ
jgi:hypothetical protein